MDVNKAVVNLTNPRSVDYGVVTYSQLRFQTRLLQETDLFKKGSADSRRFSYIDDVKVLALDTKNSSGGLGSYTQIYHNLNVKITCSRAKIEWEASGEFSIFDYWDFGKKSHHTSSQAFMSWSMRNLTSGVAFEVTSKRGPVYFKGGIKSNGTGFDWEDRRVGRWGKILRNINSYTLVDESWEW